MSRQGSSGVEAEQRSGQFPKMSARRARNAEAPQQKWEGWHVQEIRRIAMRCGAHQIGALSLTRPLL
eukprot:5554396-Prorocentrum_lima.AAC.1